MKEKEKETEEVQIDQQLDEKKIEQETSSTYNSALFIPSLLKLMKQMLVDISTQLPKSQSKPQIFIFDTCKEKDCRKWFNSSQNLVVSFQLTLKISII